MSDYISKEKLMSHIESQYKSFGEDYDALQILGDIEDFPTEQRPHGEWEALGFQQGYAFCRCSNCHKTMRLYRDSKNEFCCIADIRKKVVSCMYCGADMREGGKAK